jgi:hypothetical protein
MQRKMDQAPNMPSASNNATPIAKLAEKQSKKFLSAVLNPRDITMIHNTTSGSKALRSLRELLGSPDEAALKRDLGKAFVGIDVSDIAHEFMELLIDSENEAMFEAKYRDTFLKSGGSIGKLNNICRFIQQKVIVEGPSQNTWIPLPALADRRISGIFPSTRYGN